MKRILPLLITLALLLAPVSSLAKASAPAQNAREFFDNLLGDEAHLEESTATPEPEAPTPTPEPTLDAEFLFGDLFKDRTEEPEATPEPTLEPTLEPEPTPVAEDEFPPSGSLFDEDVRLITSSAWGGKVDFAYVGGWTVSRGYFDGKYCLTGISPEDGERVVLSDFDPMSFVPAGDAIVYYGEGTKGDYGWMLLVPGERMPQKLPLDIASEVFYADDQTVWYYIQGSGESATIGLMDRESLKKKKVGTVKGLVVARMPGDEVLLVSFTKNRVQLWKDGKYETIYSPKQEIRSVITVGRQVWIEHDDGFGPLADGQVSFRLSGRVVSTAGSSDQFAFLVLPYEESEFFDVCLVNEIYGAYAWVGRVKRSDYTYIEFQPEQMTVWGPEESVIFEYPIPELWLPYGYYDFASAENFINDEQWNQLLVGSWCAESSVGAGYGERLVFTADELYRLPAQEGKKKVKVKKSLWFVADGLLLDYVDRDSPRLLWLSGPFTVPPEEAPYSPRITINGTSYYQYSPDPAYFDDLKDYGVNIESSIGSPKAN